MSVVPGSRLQCARKVICCSILLIAGVVAPVRTAFSADTIAARATFRLCPEYNSGIVSLELKYRLPYEFQYRPLTVTAEAINPGAGTASMDFRLPIRQGVSEIRIAAFCRTGDGLSDPSAEAAISSCDVLKRFDSDGDGLPDNFEDTNCNDFYDPGDSSNPYNVDTDGDGARDLVEVMQRTDPSNPGSSPRPFVFTGGPFDPDGDGESNPVAWRPPSGNWYVKDFVTPGNNISFQFGLPGDIPFTYQPLGATGDVGVVRLIGREYLWIFRGEGFYRFNQPREHLITFGWFGDNVLPGPWEQPWTTNPAVARLFDNRWTFDIYKMDGTVREVYWGRNGDVPKVQDYDGDGIFDIAVYRPSEGNTYVIQSTDNRAKIYHYGTGTADMTVRGDFTGDGRQDITFWEPLNGMFFMLKSNNGFNDLLGAARSPFFFGELQLGLYYVHLPLSWNHRHGFDLFTVVDHSIGMRYFRDYNNPSAPVSAEQWGMPGDALG